MVFTPKNPDIPRISLGNWFQTGSLLYQPPKQAAPVKAKPAPNKIAAPKSSKAVSESTDSPDEVKKKAEGEKKKLEEDLAKKAAEEAAAKKKADEEAEAAKKKEEEEQAAAKNKADEEEAEKKKKAEEKAVEVAKTLDDALKKLDEVHKKQNQSKGRFCSDCGRRSHDGECDGSSSDNANNGPIVVNVAIDMDGATVKSSNDNSGSPQKVIEKTAEKDKADATTKATPGDNTNFTKEQDNKILSMKKDNNTWKEISTELGKTKKDAVDRFKQLSDDKVSSSGSDKTSTTEGDIDLGEITVMPGFWGDEVIVTTKTVTTKADEFDDWGDDCTTKKADEKKTNGGDKDENQMKNGNSNQQTKDGKKNTNYKKPTSEDDNNNSNAKTDSNGNNGNNGTQNVNSAPDYRTRPGEPVNGHVTISFASTIPLSGGKRLLVPDATWTTKDLEVLKEIECRYRELKWMQLSASFFNFTGRQIDPDVIKAKILENRFPEEDADGNIRPVNQ